MAEFLTALSNAGNFTRDDFALVYRAKNKDATESSCRFVLQKLLDSGSIARVGRLGEAPVSGSGEQSDAAAAPAQTSDEEKNTPQEPETTSEGSEAPEENG